MSELPKEGNYLTPRTNAIVREIDAAVTEERGWDSGHVRKAISHARTLERELAEANAMLAKNEGRVKSIVDETLLRERDEALRSLSDTTTLLSKAVYKWDSHWLNPCWVCGHCGTTASHHKQLAPECPFNEVPEPPKEAK